LYTCLSCPGAEFKPQSLPTQASWHPAGTHLAPPPRAACRAATLRPAPPAAAAPSRTLPALSSGSRRHSSSSPAGTNHAAAETDRAQGCPRAGSCCTASSSPRSGPPLTPAFSREGQWNTPPATTPPPLTRSCGLASDGHGMAINLCADFLSTELGSIDLCRKI